jgi:hypothetical protein
MSFTLTPFKVAGVVLTALTATAVQAETYTNTAGNPNTSTWNSAGFWSSDPAAVSPTDFYQVNPDATRVTNNTPIATSFTVQVGATSTPWAMYGFVRDYAGGATPSGDSTFLGGKVILTDKAAFRGFGRNTISTANWELQSGSYMVLNSSGTGGGGGTTTAWNGSITTSGTTAIGIVTNNATALTINASIAGTGTLNLVTNGGSVANLHLNGDISLFTGTLLLSNSTTKTINPGIFSIANSAPSATLQMNWESPLFQYDLSTSDVTFGSLVLTNNAGTDTVLGSGTYTADQLNFLIGNGIFMGSGSITVVPEPSTYALGILGFFVVAAAMRGRIRS